MIHLVAHGGSADWHLLTSWTVDPLVLFGLECAATAYLLGTASTARLGASRRFAFYLALLVLGVALMSPLDPLSGSLASAHMAQHLLLIVVAAPLLAYSRPSAYVIAGLPRRWRTIVRRGRRATKSVRRFAFGPVAAAGIHTVTVWVWHTRELYERALENGIMHRLEHGMFFLTALLMWVAVRRTIGPRTAQAATGILILFAMSLQGSVLGALMTFASAPWYDSYLDTTAEWGLTALADQQLAGLLMWVPAGIAYLGGALWLLRQLLLDEDSSLLHASSTRSLQDVRGRS